MTDESKRNEKVTLRGGGSGTSDEVDGTPTLDGASDMIGGRYVIHGWLGSGGMGTVYRVHDTELDEIVALKVLRRELVSSPEAVERFRQEAKLARRVTHRNVARVFDIGDHDAEKFLTMEFVEGSSLGSLVERKGALPIERILDLAVQVCEGLSAAHAADVIHRDLKPDNVLVDPNGRAVITDFGIARAFTSEAEVTNPHGVSLGTPAYMAPEQIESTHDIDHRVDIYAVGAMLYELLTGEPPWPQKTAVAVAVAQATQPTPNPRDLRAGVPNALAEIVVRCLARLRDDRYQTVRELLVDLRAIQAGEGRSTAAPVAPITRAITGPASSPADKRVAVIPYRNASQPEDEYLADGLTEDLIDTLSMGAGLKVRPRGVVMSYRNTDADPRDIGADLDVDVVIDGSVRRMGDMLRISTRLLNVSDGFQLWATRVDRPEAELLVVSDEIAHAVADALAVHFDEEKVPPTDPRSVDLYLRARHELHKFWGANAEHAAQLLEEALQYTPDVPSLVATYAFARFRVWWHASGEANASSALVSAERAVSLAPQQGEARMSLGLVRLNRGELDQGVVELARAVLHGPGLAAAHEHLGTVLIELGNVEEGCHRVRSAMAIDPHLAPRGLNQLARVQALEGNEQAADKLWSEAFELADSSVERLVGFFRARAALWRGDADAVVRHARRAEIEGPAGLIAKSLVELVEAGTVNTEMIELSDAACADPHMPMRRQVFYHQVRAEMAAFLGDHDTAAAQLSLAVEHGLMDRFWLDRCQLFSPASDTSELASIRRRLSQRANEILQAYRVLTSPPLS